MSDWLLNLPVVWMAVVIFGAAYLFAACALQGDYDARVR
jgi:hypothetical protein